MANMNKISEEDQRLLDVVSALGHRDWEITDSRLGKYVFQHRVPDQPLDLVQTIPDIGKSICGICDKGPYTTCVIQLEWGDTRKYETIRHVCRTCLNILNTQVIRNKHLSKAW